MSFRISSNVVATAAAMLTIAILPGLMRNIRQRADRPAPTKIAPEPWSMGICAVLFGAMTIAFVAVPFDPATPNRWLWWALSPLWGALCLMCVSALSKGARIEWTERSIAGPASEWFFAPRNEIAWPDIKACGTTQLRAWFLESQDGRRIYWSSGYRGWGVLKDVIARQRPDLALPIEMR